MITIEKKEDCCGCGACYNACPKKAITMERDEEGFLYPVIQKELCVNCGLCDKVCPVLNKKEVTQAPKGYIIRNRNENIVKQSTSGGAFTAFSEFLLGEGYTVYGTGYNDEMEVVCKPAHSADDLAQMRGSKFVQSKLGDTYSIIKKQLKEGEKVLFTGTPCQIAGLIRFLGEKPENLFCIDFVCRGVPSPGLWENYVAMMEKKYGSKMVSALFKNKTYGYHATTMKIGFENGATWYGSGRVDPMMKAFVNELASRPSCSACAFKGEKRESDITMFDCYEFESIMGMADDDKGYTSLLVHSQKGQDLLDKIKDSIICYDVPIEKLITKNGIMVRNSAKPNPKRQEFYKLAQTESIDVAMNHISPITTKDHLIEKSKGFLQKTGLITKVKKLKRDNLKVND